MYKIWQNITRVGTQSIDADAVTNQIILLNRLNVLVSIIYVAIGTVYFSFDDLITVGYLAILIVVNLLAFFAQKRHLRRLSQTLFLIASYLSIFYFDSYAGIDSGAFLYYLPIVPSLFLLFDVRCEKKLLLFHIMIICMLICLNYFTNHQLFEYATITATMKSNLFLCNSIFSFLSLVVIIILMQQRIKKDHFLQK